MEINGVESYEHESPAAARRPARRGAYLLPGVFTVANMLCGYYAILATFEAMLQGRSADMDYAARAIGLAILFDALDGRIARALGANSDFGREFDSLADVVSFGIAPAFLGYAWGVRNLPLSEAGQAVHIYQLGWLVGFIFVVACAWRLARFNVNGMASSNSGFFVGMPAPAGAGIVAAVIHAVSTPIQNVGVSFLWLGLMVALALLMSSTVRHYGFKNIRVDRKQSSRAFVVIALLVGSIVFYSQITLLLIASVYAVHGIVLELARLVRHRLASRPA
ncbi:MAG: phosphatidylcholine/phosphatidylserine synthase [Candidatus Acidiferrales bacterium]